MSAWSAKEAFEKGDLKTILQKISPPGKTDEEKVALIGALAFLGRWVESESLAKSFFDQLKAPHQARIGFCLAVAFTRASQFKKARHWLKAIIQNPKTASWAESSQAMAFHYFFTGDFQHSLKWGRRALRRALASGDSFIHLASLDILAHSQVQMGRRSSGLRLFDEVLVRAEEKAYFTLALSTRLAKLRYEAEAGLRPLTILQELEKALDSLPAVDTYSRAGLVMEISRQLTLRGRWSQARELLGREATLIYSFQDRRQEMTLLLRMGEISFRQGDFVGALHFVRSAYRCLNLVADKVYEARVLGLEAKIYRDLKSENPPAENLKRQAELSEILPNKMNSHILSRLQENVVEDSTPGEDLMHDLFLELKRDPTKGRLALIEKGYLGLWPLASGFKPGEEALIVDEKEHLISVSRDGVFRSEESIPARPLKLLQKLSQGSCSKEELIQSVWGYTYDPLRHDSLVYSGLASLRSLLGPVSYWIETQDSNWILKNQVKLVDERKLSNKGVKKIPTELKEDQDFQLFQEFSFRQLKALKTLNAREYWDMKSYKAAFKVSTMTAWRDLSSFTKKGYLLKCGRGPATRYVPQSKETT